MVQEGRGDILKVAYTNVNGLASSVLEINDYLSTEKPDIMAITETKLSGNIDAFNLGDGKYNIWTRNRENKKGGGVMLLLRKEWAVDGVSYGEGEAEVLNVKVKMQRGGHRNVVVVYAPPKTNSWTEELFKRKLEETRECLRGLLRMNEKILIMGDLNCKEVSWENWSTEGSDESWGSKVLELATENFLTQWVEENTRFRGNEVPSRLDLIFTKEPDIIEKMIYKSPIGKSDHVLIEYILREGGKGKKNEDYKKEWYNFNRANFEQLKKYFEEAQWNGFFETDDIEEKWAFLLRTYNEGVEKWVPKMKMDRNSKEEWYNRKCEEAWKVKERAWNKWRKNRREDLWNEYKRKRNEYIRTRRGEKKKFEKNIVDKCKDQPKLFYKFINKKLKNRDEIQKVKVNGETFDGTKEIVEEMNKCFQTVFTRESDFVEGDEEPYPGNGLERVQTTTEEVTKLLEELDVRKSGGPDGVSGWVLKECKQQLAGKLSNLINVSLTQGRVPMDWKRANIVPIFKGGDKEDPLNYRPVSLTSVVAKLCEKIIKGRWVKHLENNITLTNNQFGFREGRSCVTNLISFYSRVIDIVQERDGWVDCVYLDLKKAFDKVPHKRLIWKLKHVGGVRGSTLEWMTDFLTGRKMRTVIRNTKSSWMEVTSGVPQGSVLAPIMFVIYINDMTEGVTSYMNMFADDAKILRRVRNEEDCVALNQDLERVSEWSRKWEMAFNTKKCSVLEFGKSNRRVSGNYLLNNERIMKRTEEKDLGVTVADNLSFGKHINKITGETYNLVKNIRTAFTYIDEEMVKKLITSMIRPRLEYAALVWSPNLKKEIRKVERIQRAATKLPETLRDCTYEERLEKLGLITLEKRRERGDLIALYRIQEGLEKIDREDLVVRDGMETRGNSKKLKRSVCRRNIKKYSFPYRSIPAWNGLDEETVCAKTIHEFKANLDKKRYGDGTARA